MQTDTGIDVKNLSDRRLWEILRLAETDEQRAATALIAHARDELSVRILHAWNAQGIRHCCRTSTASTSLPSAGATSATPKP